MRNRQLWILLVTLVLVAVSIVTVIQKPTKQGLDLAGGTRLVLEAQTEKLPAKEKWDVDKQNAVIRIVRQRVDVLGVLEPVIQPKGDKQVVVELPNITDRQEAIDRYRPSASGGSAPSAASGCARSSVLDRLPDRYPHRHPVCVCPGVP